MTRIPSWLDGRLARWAATYALASLTALAGCGSSEPAVGSPTATASDFGTTAAAWDANHPADASHPDGYLPRLADGSDSYTNRHVSNGRIDGFVLHAMDHTVTETSAARLIAAEIPADAHQVFEKRHYMESSAADDQCDVIQFQSATVASTLSSADRDGVIMVELSRSNDSGFPLYDPRNITTLSFSASGVLGFQGTEC